MKKINKCIVYFFLVLAIVFIEENICVAGDSQYAGLGTKENPYLISTIKQLDNIRLDLNAHYALTCNLVFSEIDFLEDGEFYNAGKGWLPIALDEDNMFKGSLNGNGHSIKGLFFKNDCDIISLFGYSSGSIYDLNIENSTVDGEDVNAAGLVVYNYGIIQNCSFSGKINGYGHVGGIAAMNFGVISNCESNGEVYSEGTVKPDLNSGYTYGSSSIGGVCGANEGSITNSINKAVVLANLSSPNKDATISVSAGGVCGNNKGML